MQIFIDHVQRRLSNLGHLLFNILIYKQVQWVIRANILPKSLSIRLPTTMATASVLLTVRPLSCRVTPSTNSIKAEWVEQLGNLKIGSSKKQKCVLHVQGETMSLKLANYCDFLLIYYHSVAMLTEYITYCYTSKHNLMFEVHPYWESFIQEADIAVPIVAIEIRVHT